MLASAHPCIAFDRVLGYLRYAHSYHPVQITAVPLTFDEFG